MRKSSKHFKHRKRQTKRHIKKRRTYKKRRTKSTRRIKKNVGGVGENAKVEQDPTKKSPTRSTLSRERKISLFQATPSALAEYNYIKQLKENIKELTVAITQIEKKDKSKLTPSQKQFLKVAKEEVKGDKAQLKKYENI